MCLLSDYKDRQSLAYNLFRSELNNGMLSHAYLIDDNNSGDSFSIVKAFIKEILTDKHDSLNECSCSICRMVDNDSYPEVKIIKPDGMYIKKGQLLELQQEFSRSAVYGKKKIYIILECEKMRTESANSILKFLEEPSDGIIAFLITNNFNNVLSTIVSRCQIVKLNNNNINDIYNEYVDFSLNFIDNIENKGLYCLLNVKDIWFNVIDSKNRDGMIVAFDNMISMYYDILKLMLNNDNNICFSDFYDVYMKIVEKNNMESVIFKLNCLIKAKDSIKFNVNSNLLVDSIILNLGGYNECSRC